jgi:hypothetical protein
MSKKKADKDNQFIDSVRGALEPSELQHRLLIARMLGHDKDYLNEVINEYYDKVDNDEIRKTKDKKNNSR